MEDTEAANNAIRAISLQDEKSPAFAALRTSRRTRNPTRASRPVKGIQSNKGRKKSCRLCHKLVPHLVLSSDPSSHAPSMIVAPPSVMHPLKQIHHDCFHASSPSQFLQRPPKTQVFVGQLTERAAQGAASNHAWMFGLRKATERARTLVRDLLPAPGTVASCPPSPKHPTVAPTAAAPPIRKAARHANARITVQAVLKCQVDGAFPCPSSSQDTSAVTSA